MGNAVRRLLLACGALLLCALPTRSVMAQGTVTGKITAEGSGTPIAGAHLLVIGGQATAVAGEDGKYTLHNVRAGTVEVQALNVGFRSLKKTVTVADGGTATLDFELPVSVTKLADVVVSATGQAGARRIELGNAVSTLGDVPLNVETKPIANITETIQAKTPGVQVLPSPVLGGAPQIRVRGTSSLSLSNQPIWVVDGVRYNQTQGANSSGQTPLSLLNNLSPEEIEDIEIVKGPSAATLYGTNAANGVVVVTTRKGRAGKARWNFTAETRTVDDRNEYPNQAALWGHSPATPAVNTRCQLATMNVGSWVNPALAAASQCSADSLTFYNPLADPSNTFIKLGRGSLFGMNVSGGNENVRYFVSGDLDNEFGPIQMDAPDIRWYNDSLHTPVTNSMFRPRSQQKLNFRTNVSASVSPKLDMNVNAGFGKSDNSIEPDNSLLIGLIFTGEAGYGYKGCPGNASPCGLDKPYRDPTGFPQHDYNSFAPGSIMQYVTPVDVQRFTGSYDVSWRPLTWLQNDGTVGIDLANQDVNHLCRLNECPQSGATSRVGNVFDQHDNRRNFSTKGSSTATWQYTNSLNFKTSAGFDYTNEERDQLFAQGRGLAPGASSLGGTATFVSYSFTPPTAVKTLGYYIQEQASLRDRLFLTLAARQDQNSAFGSNFQHITYPKVSASYVISDEDFFPKFSWLDNLRLRTAYGENGVQPGATSGLTTFQANTQSIAKVDANTGTDTPGLAANNPGNANLKPETSAEFESGFETDVLSRRLHFSYTFYNKKTHDALINVPIPASVGASVTSLIQNVGSTQNCGHEVEANAQLYSSRMVAWDVTVAGSHNSNKWVDLGLDATTGKERVIGAGATTEQRQGHPLNEQWYKPYRWVDQNGDGIIQACTKAGACAANQVELFVDSARVGTGYNTARDLFSIQNGLDLFDHKFRVNLSFDYKGGGNIQDGTNNFDCPNNVPLSCPETQDRTTSLAKQARAVAATYGYIIGDTVAGVVKNTSVQKSNGGYFMSQQFWKFREASVVYQLPDIARRYIGGQTGSNLVLGMRNMHTWTSFSGIDPEANYGLTQTDVQNEFNTAPLPLYITVRLNLKY